MWPRHRIPWLSALVICVTACAPKGAAVDPDTRRVQSAASDARRAMPDFFIHAQDVRVHPASRYVVERGELRLEARIELLDVFNEPVKDVGVVAVELRVLDPNGRMILDDQGRQRGFRWTFDLTTADMQRDHWDPIARAYVLPLKIAPDDADLAGYRTVLRVTFDPAWPGKPTLPTGERQATEIRTDW